MTGLSRGAGMVAPALPCTKSVAHHLCFLCFLFALSFESFSTCRWAQTQLGTLFGTVTDSSGAAVPKAEVSAENVGTGLKRDALTDLTGQYHIAGLPPGTYSVRVEKEGFQT